MMQTETGEDIRAAEIGSGHERNARAVHRAHQFQFFLKKSLLENDVLRCAVTREEVFLRAPPLLLRLRNIFQTWVAAFAKVINKGLSPFDFKSRHLPGLTLNEVGENLLRLLLIVCVEHTRAARSYSAGKLRWVCGWRCRVS